MDPKIRTYLENLTKKLNLNNDNPMRFLSLQSTEKENADDFLDFLIKHQPKLFTNTWCFRPSFARLVGIYGGDYMVLVRPIKNSDMALWIYLLKTKKRGIFLKKIDYKINIAEFNLTKTLQNNKNYKALKKDNLRLVNATEIFSRQCNGTLYRRWFKKIINIFYKKRKFKKTVFTELKRFEKEMRFFIDNDFSTIQL